jgi:hypothetical protein
MENHKDFILNPFRQHSDQAGEAAENAFVRSIVERSIRFMQGSLARGQRITDVYASPAEIRAAVSLPLDGPAIPLAALDAEIERMIPFLVRTRHPMFFNQLFAGQDVVGVAAQWFSTACNTSVRAGVGGGDGVPRGVMKRRRRRRRKKGPRCEDGICVIVFWFLAF